jgi:hypothetical protein
MSTYRNELPVRSRRRYRVTLEIEEAKLRGADPAESAEHVRKTLPLAAATLARVLGQHARDAFSYVEGSVQCEKITVSVKRPVEGLGKII